MARAAAADLTTPVVVAVAGTAAPTLAVATAASLTVAIVAVAAITPLTLAEVAVAAAAALAAARIFFYPKTIPVEKSLKSENKINIGCSSRKIAYQQH